MKTTTKRALEKLNTVSSGWTAAESGRLLCSAHKSGGIIDVEIASGQWFVIFNGDTAGLSGFKTQEDAVKAFCTVRKFEQAAPEFRAKIEAIALVLGLPSMPAIRIFELWLEYAHDCELCDQSPILWEFVQWKRWDLVAGDEDQVRLLRIHCNL